MSESTATIQPALTPEEWEDFLVQRNDPAWEPSPFLHAAAARCLYGQPFGFTWEDVGLLEKAMDFFMGTPDAGTLASLTDRIAALLPPKTNG